MGKNRSPMGVLKGTNPVVRKLWNEFPKLSIQSGILCHAFKPNPYAAVTHQVVLTDRLVPTALKALHGDSFSGHLGTECTLRKAREICYWPYMLRDIYISTVVGICHVNSEAPPLHMRKHLCSPCKQTIHFRKLPQIYCN